MKRILGALLLLTTTALTVWGKPNIALVPSHPKPPNREMLRRMDMDLRWHLKIPRWNMKDALFSVQIIPGADHPQLIVQTVLGEVMLLDAESGDIVWRNQLERVPTSGMFPCAYNSHSIYVVRNDVLHILDRASGIRLLYTFDPKTKTRSYYAFALFDTTPPGVKLTPPRPPIGKPYATPVADEDGLYYTAGDRVIALNVPNYRQFNDPFPLTSNSLKPSFRWMMFTGNVGVKHAPIVTTHQIGIVQGRRHLPVAGQGG